jgi:hypothetical protein
MLEIDGHRAAATIHQIDVGVLTGWIGGPVGPVDPNDVCPGIGQHHAGERRWTKAGQLNDAYAFEGAAHRAHRAAGEFEQEIDRIIMAGWWRTPGQWSNAAEFASNVRWDVPKIGHRQTRD